MSARGGESHGVAAAGRVVAGHSVPAGSADAAHAALRAVVVVAVVVRGTTGGVAAEKGGGGRGRPAAGRPDDGALARGHAVHVRPDHGPGRHTDRGDDAVHAGPDQQAVDQVQDRRAHTGRLRQGHVRSGDGHRLHKRSVFFVFFFCKRFYLLLLLLHVFLNRFPSERCAPGCLVLRSRAIPSGYRRV